MAGEDTDVAERIYNLVEEVLQVDRMSIDVQDSLIDDLKATSLDLLTLSLALEDEFGGTVRETDLGDLRTVGDLIQYIESRLYFPDKNEA